MIYPADTKIMYDTNLFLISKIKLLENLSHSSDQRVFLSFVKSKVHHSILSLFIPAACYRYTLRYKGSQNTAVL